MKKAKLIIAIPSQTHVHADFALCLANMFSDLSQPIAGWVIQFAPVNIKTSILAKSRQKLVEFALENKATHLLFIDSDMVFPPATARGLLTADLPVIAANCPTKTFPSIPTARDFDINLPAGKPVPIQDGPVREVWRVGTGIMMLQLDIFKNMPRPWFGNRWEPRIQDIVGEDWFFCEQLQEAGHKIYIDQRLSITIKHIGEYSWSVADMADEHVNLPELKNDEG